MKKNRPAPEIDTFVIGPSVCRNFANKDLCHYCVSKSLFRTAICFARPAGSNTVENN